MVISVGDVWRLFILKALKGYDTFKGTRIVTPSAYLEAVRNGRPPAKLVLPLWALGGPTEAGLVIDDPPSDDPPPPTRDFGTLWPNPKVELKSPSPTSNREPGNQTLIQG